MKSKFWHIHSDNLHKRADWVGEEVDSETVICPANKGHQRAGKRLTDLSVDLPGKKVEDFWRSFISVAVDNPQMRPKELALALGCNLPSGR